MGKAKPVEIGGIAFAKKGDALTHLKEILNRYRPTERISDEDATFLKVALQRHPDADEKIGTGIDHFEVQVADYDTQCFCVARTDGSYARFSYKYCV